MATFQPGLVHTPVTPFDANRKVDYGLYAKIIEFHLKHGADALALPMHAGESISLGVDERKQLLEFAIGQVKGRVPVIAHASESGTSIAADLARHAESAGAAAIIVTPPYYWTPPANMLVEHYAQVGAGVKIPLFVYNSPEELGGAKLTTPLALQIIAKVPNFAGVVDCSLDWQFMIELITFAPKQRAGFQLWSGTEHMISAGAIGATTMLAPLAGVAPKLMRNLYDVVREDRPQEGRALQFEVAALRQVVKAGGVAALKVSLAAMGRGCGVTRPPLPALEAAEAKKVTDAIQSLKALTHEPRGW
jgi:dihydrodipicolinate synthase/N-acetylneuraminate lyase